MLARSIRILACSLCTTAFVAVPYASAATIAAQPSSAAAAGAAAKRPKPKPKAKQPKPNKVIGTNGNDTLNGSSGVDLMRGRRGNDVLNGNAGNDTISGDAGNDVIRGGTGVDVLLGGAGNDRIYARDQEADTISCGNGRDIVWADEIDVVTGDCEIVRVNA